MSRNPSLKRPMERRNIRRLPCRAPVRVYATPDRIAESFILDSTNMSSDGVFLHTDLLFPVGEWLDLEFVVPGRAQPVRGRGKVVRVEGSVFPPGPGVAVQIPGLSEEDRTALRRMDSGSVRAAQA